MEAVIQRPKLLSEVKLPEINILSQWFSKEKTKVDDKANGYNVYHKYSRAC